MTRKKKPKLTRTTTVYKSKERVRLVRQEAFLKFLSETGIVTTALEKAGIAYHTYATWQQRDEKFKEQVAEAVEISTQKMEAEAHRRAVRGVKKPVFYRGEEVGQIDEYSDGLLMFLLRSRRPDVYGDKVKISGNLNHEGEIRIVEATDWYGNSDRLPAETFAPHAPRVAVAVTVQSPVVRPPVEQDSNGPADGLEGPRGIPGPTEGGD